MTAPSIVWFRRDLRLHDHAALARAAADGPVVGLFVWDPALLAASGAPRTASLHDTLAALDTSTDGHLVVLAGDPAEIVPGVAAAVGASTVHVSKDFGPAGRRRDAAVAERLRADDRRLVGHGSPYAIDPGGVAKDDGDPYRVFTPFFRRWLDVGWTPPAGAVDVEWVAPNGEVARLSTTPPPDRPEPGCELPAAGERAAHETWERFLDDGLDGYDDDRDLPALDATSHLSHHLKWGTIHPSRLLDDLARRSDLGQDGGPRTFASELAWRDFYADVLFQRPRTAWSNLNDRMDAIVVDTDADARRRFERWAAGRTGFRIVDAGMRQLAATGWMHNRVRMIVASFLVKDLHLPWQWGARHFLEHLVDGDVASNNHGWQWAAGTGTDAAPYFRVFNPHTQADKWDPDGEYVARWVDEIGTDAYPAPMVDHAAERREALARYEAVKGR